MWFGQGKKGLSGSGGGEVDVVFGEGSVQGLMSGSLSLSLRSPLFQGLRVSPSSLPSLHLVQPAQLRLRRGVYAICMRRQSQFSSSVMSGSL